MIFNNESQRVRRPKVKSHGENVKLKMSQITDKIYVWYPFYVKEKTNQKTTAKK